MVFATHKQKERVLGKKQLAKNANCFCPANTKQMRNVDTAD